MKIAKQIFKIRKIINNSEINMIKLNLNIKKNRINKI